MTAFRVVISDTKTSKAYQLPIEGSDNRKLIGKNIGDTINGDIFGMSGYILTITGGTDKDGFPMKRGLQGTGRRKILVSKGVGYKPQRKGVRRRKTIRGSEISSDISQINTAIIEYGSKPIEEIFNSIGGKSP